MEDTTSQPVERMSFLDRFLPVWIMLAMAAGLALGRAVPGLSGALERLEVGGISLPIALGLLIMMYPPLAKVRYDKTREIATDKRLMTVSIILNWIVGPAFMFALAWIFLPNEPELRTGLIIVGLARCIAMVLVWSDLACADREATAVLVAINSVFQVLMFGVLGWFYLQVLPWWTTPTCMPRPRWWSAWRDCARTSPPAAWPATMSARRAGSSAAWALRCTRRCSHPWGPSSVAGSRVT